MLSEDSFPSLKKPIPATTNDSIIQKPVLKYSDVLKQKKNVNNVLKFNNTIEKDHKFDAKTDILINTISEKTEKFSFHESKSPIECNISKPQVENNLNKNNKNSVKQNKKEDICKKYQNDIDSIIRIQTWWRMVSKIKSMKTISENKKEIKEIKEKENGSEKEKKEVIEKKEKVCVKSIPKKPSFSDIVKLTPPPSPISNEKQNETLKKSYRKNKKGNHEHNANENSGPKGKVNEKKSQNKSKKENEELNAIFKNMKFMGLIEKEIDALTEKNTIVNGKQFAKTKVVTVKKFSRYGSSSSNFSIDDVVDNAKDSKKKNNKNENKSSDKKSHAKKNVCFNEKDEVFNEYSHVMKKLDLQRRCDKKSCLIDCYRRLYKREWEDDEVSEESSSSLSNSESEDGNENTVKKSDYLYNDIYNPNYTKYYSGSDFDFGNRYFTGKERLKKALHLEPVEVTVQKIIYQPMKFQKNNKRFQQKNKKNNNKRKQRN